MIPPKIELIDEEFLNNLVDASTTIVVNSESSYVYIKELLNKKFNLIKSQISSSNMIDLSYISFKNNIFEDLAYTEPMYVKKPYVS